MQCKNLVITSGTGVGVVVTNLTGPASVLKGSIATFTATITNNSGTNTAIGVSFLEQVSGSLISRKGTGMIAPGGSQDLPIDINTSSWGIADWVVCAKTDSETVYSVCKPLNIYGPPPPPPPPPPPTTGTSLGTMMVVAGALLVGFLGLVKFGSGSGTKRHKH